MRDGRGQGRRVVRVCRAIAIGTLLIAAVFDTAGSQVDVAGFPAAPRVVEPRWDGSRIPFGAGERLTYSVRIAGTGATGKGEMTVTGPVDLQIGRASCRERV